MSNKLEQLEFKFEKVIWIQKHAEKVRKIVYAKSDKNLCRCYTQHYDDIIFQMVG